MRPTGPVEPLKRRWFKRRSGAPFEWEHGKANALRLSQYPTDWTGYNTLSLWMYSPKATGSRFMLISGFGTRQGQSTRQLTNGAEIRVDFTGWKQFQFDLKNDFFAARSPIGWKEDQTVFTFTGQRVGTTPQIRRRLSTSTTSVLLDIPPPQGTEDDRSGVFSESLEDLARPRTSAGVKTAAGAGRI